MTQPEPYQALSEQRYATIEQSDGLLSDADLLFGYRGITYLMLEDPFDGDEYHIRLGAEHLQEYASFSGWDSCLITYSPAVQDSLEESPLIEAILSFHLQRFDATGEIREAVLIDLVSGEPAILKDVIGDTHVLEFIRGNPEEAESLILIRGLEQLLKSDQEKEAEYNEPQDTTCLTVGVMEDMRRLLESQFSW